MAAAAYAASMEEELTCSVCFELFVDPNTPKELDCAHVICEICVKPLLRPGKSRQLQDRVVECPECRKLTKVPDVSRLKTNRRLRNLAEKHKKHVNDTWGNDKSQASSANVAGAGDSNKLTESHAEMQGAEMMCGEHKDENVNYFCKTCDVLVCQKCIVSSHHEKTCHHDIADLTKVYKDKLKIVRSEIFKAEYDSETYSEEWSKEEERHWDILSYSYLRQEKIDKEFEGCTCDPPDYVDSLKDQVDKECEEDSYESQDRQEMLEQRAEELQDLANDAQVLVDHATLAEFFKQYKTLIEKMRAIPRLKSSGQGLSQFGSLIKRLDLDPVILGLETCSLEDQTGARPNAKSAGTSVKSARQPSAGPNAKSAAKTSDSSHENGNVQVVHCPSVFVAETIEPQQLPDSHQLFVGNLPQDISEHELKIFFSKYGNVIKVAIHQKRDSRKAVSFAFVSFDKANTVEYLLSLKGRMPLFRGEWRLNLEVKKASSRRRGRGRSNYNH